MLGLTDTHKFLLVLQIILLLPVVLFSFEKYLESKKQVKQWTQEREKREEKYAEIFS